MKVTSKIQQGLTKHICVCVISTIVRIQFRLPDGSSFTNQFPLQGRLQEVRQFVVQVWFYLFILPGTL